jgi:aminomethyltransferase
MSGSSASARELRRTPLWARHVAAGAKMVPFAGWEMPVQYSGLVDEHRAVRGAAGLFDVSHMGEIAVRGPGAAELLQHSLTNDVGRLRDGRAQYQLLLREGGGIVDDLLVYRRADGDYLLVVNAGGRDGDLLALQEAARGRSGVEVVDLSDDTALLALQGPAAAGILQPLASVALEPIAYYGHAPAGVAGRPALLSRTGYTGEDGFEIYLRAGDAEAVWDALVEAGSGSGLVPVGLGARDTLRLEAGMLLAGQDFDASVLPDEVGLGWAVRLDKGDFVGRPAVAAVRASGLRRHLVAFGLVEKGIARHGYPARLGGDGASGSSARPEGAVTSGTWSPSLERSIGLAFLASAEPFEAPAEGAPLLVEIRGRAVEGRVESKPFYRRPRRT